MSRLERVLWWVGTPIAIAGIVWVQSRIDAWVLR